MQGPPPDLWSGPGARVTHGSPVVITYSPGGSIGLFIAEFTQIAQLGIPVVIDGPCLSACTMATSLPNVCATPRGVLGFHQGFVFDPWGRRHASREGTAAMAQHWSPAAQQWVAHHHLTLNIKLVKATDLVKPCAATPV
jgi:hypothetical protein